MRPVKRIQPLKDEDGIVKTFTKYVNARKDLIDNFGGYCSYCEMKLDASLAVEHVQPKSVHDGLELEWSNFLLGCTNCNSIKNDQDPGIGECVWPDKDNTLLAFSYGEGGVVKISDNLPLTKKALASETMKLVGLDRKPNSAKVSDRRWLNRMAAWAIAEHAKDRLSRNFDNGDFRSQIVDTCVTGGYWSVWMTVFKDDTNMCQRFIDAMPGTAQDCFNANAQAVNRPGGQI